MIGETIGKYRVLEAVGRGGVGTVYRARDDVMDRDVAIKVLNTATVDAVQVRRFETEADALSRLRHPGITAILDLIDHDKQRLMVMEMLHGETLDHLVRRQGPVMPVRAAALMIQALAALGEAHGAGIVHRDIKPGNLMLTTTGPLKILDFGVALVSGADRLTEAGFLVGTPAYMAPEQVTGAPVDSRTDLYAAGLVFYFLVTGKLPFSGKTPALIADARVTGLPEPARAHRRDLNDWVIQVLARALARQPDDRYQSADEFREALESGVRGHPVRASGVLLAPEEETVAMSVAEFARPRPVGLEDPTQPPQARPAPGSRRPLSPATIVAGAVFLAVVIVWLLIGR